MNVVKIFVLRLPHAQELPMPEYMTSGAAGMDLLAAVDEPLTLLPGKCVLVPTGLQLAIPAGFEAQVRPRSGLAIKHGVSVLNSPGTIDADYRGEVKVILVNFGEEAFMVARGDRIAQLVFNKVYKASFCQVEILPESGRGEGGFGHTGV